jgi:hypothetical protein
MTKTETTILESKTPADYIDRSLKARLSPAAKAKLARLWMESTGYSKEDILRARNRHPYWKRKKMEGSAERTRRRLAAHDYSSGSSVQWNAKLVTEFLELNRRESDGRYEWKDWQLAEHFGATIPSIQYMRRKLSKVELLLGARASRGKVVEYLQRAESVLSRGKAAVEAVKTSRKVSAVGKKKAVVGKSSKAKLAKVKSKAAKPAARKRGSARSGAAKAGSSNVRGKGGAPGKRTVKASKKG